MAGKFQSNQGGEKFVSAVWFVQICEIRLFWRYRNEEPYLSGIGLDKISEEFEEKPTPF